jgi:hypothetical protein
VRWDTRSLSPANRRIADAACRTIGGSGPIGIQEGKCCWGRRRAKIAAALGVASLTFVVAPAAEAATGLAACTAEGYGNQYTFNGSFEYVLSRWDPPEYTFKSWEYEFNTSNAEDIGIDRMNDVVIEIRSGGNLVWAYTSTDDKPYAEPQVFFGGPTGVDASKKVVVEFDAAFDERGQPDKHCIAKWEQQGIPNIANLLPPP